MGRAAHSPPSDFPSPLHSRFVAAPSLELPSSPKICSSDGNWLSIWSTRPAGAEEFAFDLKNQKRATIVGETTGGGAHPVAGHTVADYFMVGVPFAKSLDPVTKTNWEGTGVEPDVKVPAADALATAEKLATEKIQAKKASK